MNLTENETKIIEVLRELKPFERVEIVKDQKGRPDYYFIHREQKVVIKDYKTTKDLETP